MFVILKYVIPFVLGAFLMWFLLKGGTDKVVTVVKTVTTTDTVFVATTDTVFITKNKIEQKVIRDTVLVSYSPHIRAFKTLSPSLYGDVSVTGEVLGELLSMSVITNFKIPTITNSIVTKETITKTKTPKGLFLGASITTLLQPSLKADFLYDQFIFSYNYGINDKQHEIGISKKLF